MLEEVKFLQKQREKRSGISAIPTRVVGNGGLVPKKVSDKNEGDGEKDDLVLQDTFAQETAVMVEDPNMYVCVSAFCISSPSFFLLLLLVVFNKHTLTMKFKTF